MRWWCQRTTPWSRNYPTSSESGPSSGRGSMQLSPPTLPVIIVTSSVCICTLTLCSFLMQETYGARAITYTQSYTPNITILCNRKQNKLSPVDWLSLYTHTHTHTHTHTRVRKVLWRRCERFLLFCTKQFLPNTPSLSLSRSVLTGGKKTAVPGADAVNERSSRSQTTDPIKDTATREHYCTSTSSTKSQCPFVCIP